MQLVYVSDPPLYWGRCDYGRLVCTYESAAFRAALPVSEPHALTSVLSFRHTGAIVCTPKPEHLFLWQPLGGTLLCVRSCR